MSYWKIEQSSFHSPEWAAKKKFTRSVRRKHIYFVFGLMWLLERAQYDIFVILDQKSYISNSIKTSVSLQFLTILGLLSKSVTIMRVCRWSLTYWVPRYSQRSPNFQRNKLARSGHTLGSWKTERERERERETEAKGGRKGGMKPMKEGHSHLTNYS